MMFSQKRWLVGVTGGIAAYKTPELIRLLRQAGAEVRVVMSAGAKEFVTQMTLQAVSGQPVHEHLFDPAFEAAMGHISLAKWADNILIAPLSANRLAALAHGFADDLLTTLCLASRAKVWVAPAMNHQMWSHPSTQQNVELLTQRGVQILGPEYGEQACGDVGWGRMLAPEAILDSIQGIIAGGSDSNSASLLEGLNLLITAGPTREYLDPIRYMSNRSSGKMGYALAKAARDLGAKVTLITGPVSLQHPEGVLAIPVESAQSMFDQVAKHAPNTDIFISCAAVADFRFEETSHQKIKKHPDQEKLTLHLVKNPDILGYIAEQEKRPFCVGFAAETHHATDFAQDKLKRKNLDMIALNEVNHADIGFDSEDNQLTLFSARETCAISKAPKYDVAIQLLKKIRDAYDAKNKT